MESAREEFEAYRAELDTHLRESERHLFAGLSALDEREQALQRIEWNTHVRDLQRIARAVERELMTPGDSVLYESFGMLRRAMRRHCSQDERLLRAGTQPDEAEPRMQETRA
jgi:hypothetical protein